MNLGCDFHVASPHQLRTTCVKQFPTIISTSSAPLTELDEGVRPHGAADALGLVGDDELLLQLIQEAEGQHVGVVARAHHHVADAQRAGETEKDRKSTQ